jgi:cell division protein FtsW (lipid II flippase)
MLLKVLFIVIVFICQMYVLKFQSSAEGKDERGREIQYKTNHMLYSVLYLGVILLIVLQLTDIVSIEQLPDLLLYFVLLLSVFGSVFTLINKNRKNY